MDHAYNFGAALQEKFVWSVVIGSHHVDSSRPESCLFIYNKGAVWESGALFWYKERLSSYGISIIKYYGGETGLSL